MQKLNPRRLTPVVATLLGALAWASGGGMAGAAEAPVIGNAGFENGLTGWTEIEPASTSTVAHTGEKSARLSGTTGRIKRTISGLSPGTGYALSGWVLGNAKIGVRNHGATEAFTTKNVTSWSKATVTFTTGPSSTSAEIYAAWASGGDARIDDMALAVATDVEITPPASRVTASTSNSNTPAMAVDNSLSTRWSGYGNGAWLRLDLGTAKTVGYVKVAIYNGSTRRARFDLQVSSDGSSWKTVWSGSSSGTTSGRQTYNFTDVQARYVRYVGHGYTSSGVTSNWNSVTEIEVFGSNPTSTSTPTTGTYPGDVLDLTNWKLQLPTGSEGSVTEVKQPALDTYSNSPYFRLNTDKDGVRFRAPTSGVTTSGSNYPRSELREMIDNGATKAAWSSTSGTHRMFIDQAVNAVPRGKRHIVVGQIHDAEDDVIVVRLDYPKLYVDIGGVNGPVLDADYALGQRFTVEFVVEDGKTKVYYNGSSTPAYTLSKSYSGAYFKAGAYTQSNCDTEEERGEQCGTDNYGEVTIYDLRVDRD